MSKKDRYFHAETEGIHEVRRSFVNLPNATESTLNDPKILHKTGKILAIQGLDKGEIKDIILDRIKEKL